MRIEKRNSDQSYEHKKFNEGSPKKRLRFIEKKVWEKENSVQEQEKEIISLSNLLKSNSDRNSRCVPVDTISPAPEGRRTKKQVSKGKNQLVKFRCSSLEKRILVTKAKLCGLSLSEYLRRAAMDKTTIERLSDEEIELYKMLVKYHNNFKSIGNMFKGKNENLTNMVYDTASEIKKHLKKFSK